MSSEVFNLAILLTLKDGASSGLDRFEARLRSAGKEGKDFLSDFDKLRSNLKRDIAIGSVGVATLVGLKKQIDVAGDYESKILDLKSAYQEANVAGSRSVAQQKQDIEALTKLATRLGGDLMGSTGDYVEILSSMRKAGIDVETVLGGAGEAAAFLANTSKAIGSGMAPEMAKELGQYGKMFDLKTGEYKSAVNLFSALKDRFDLGSSELVEGSKYFASTAKTAMGLRGFEGATEVAKLIAFSKRYTGYEGSRSGTNLDAIITQFVQHPEAVKALEQKSKIKLDFFDDKGQWRGNTAQEKVENLFRQMEKLRALAPKDRLETLNNIFGVEGGRIAGQMVEQGVDGYRSITAEASKAVPVQEKIIAQMGTYNAKVEALSGSWTNFKATAFTGLMEDTKGFLDTANSLVSWFQAFAQGNPTIAKTATELVAATAAAATLYAGIKSIGTGIQMFRMFSAVSRSGGLVGYLRAAGAEADAVGTKMSTATTKTRGLGGALQGLGTSRTVSVGVNIASIVGIELLLFWIQREVQKALNAGTSLDNAFSGAKSHAALIQSASDLPQTEIANTASIAWMSAMKTGLGDVLASERQKQSFGMQFSKAAGQTWLYPISAATGATNPFASGLGFARSTDSIAAGFKQSAPQLADSRVMLEFLRQLDTRVPVESERQDVRKGVAKAFPESFDAAIKQLETAIAQAPVPPVPGAPNMWMNQPTNPFGALQPQTINDVSTGFASLPQPVNETKDSLVNLGTEANKLPASFSNIFRSANDVSSSLDGVSAKLANWTPPASGSAFVTGPDGQPIAVPSNAVGGHIERDGFAYVHAGNKIVPAKKRAYEGDGGLSVTYSPSVKIYGTDNAAKAEFAAMLYDHKRDIENIVAGRYKRGRERA